MDVKRDQMNHPPDGVAGDEESAKGVRLGIRTYLSTNFLWTAKHFCALTGIIEKQHVGRPRFDPEHRAYVLGAVHGAAMFLEAVVNELFGDAADGHGLTGDGYLASLPVPTQHAMAEFTQSSGERLSTLDKYQMLLVLAGKETLDRDSEPFQSAALVVRLRNALVHFQPETLFSDQSSTIERRLRGKFPDNRLMSGAGNPWWPDHALGEGCCTWVLDRTLVYIDETMIRLDIRPNYKRIFEAKEPYGRAPGRLAGKS